MTIVEKTCPVTAGVDTHADVHVAAVVDGVGGVLGIESFTTTEAGCVQLIGWLRAHGSVNLVGVEGTGSYGAGLTRQLERAGIAVVEVDRPNRQVRRREGKSDPVDAVVAARAALSGQALGLPKARTGDVEAIRVLMVARRSATSERIATLCQLRHSDGLTPSNRPTPARRLFHERSVDRHPTTRAGRDLPGACPEPRVADLCPFQSAPAP